MLSGHQHRAFPYQYEPFTGNKEPYESFQGEVGGAVGRGVGVLGSRSSTASDLLCDLGKSIPLCGLL